MTKGKTIAIIGVGATPAFRTLLESARDDIVLLDVTQRPPLPEPFVIKASPIVTYRDYTDGKTNRRERRKRERRKPGRQQKS